MLMLHRGAEPIDFDRLRQVGTPEPTKTHVPIPHHRLVDSVRHSLGYFGHEIVEEQHGVTEDGMRYFGVMLLRSRGGLYQDMVGLRNSHDKSFPIGLSFGGHVFVCDNLSIIGDQVVKRRHTANAKRDLPGLIMEMVEPLADVRDRQARTFELYRDTPITVDQADHGIMELYRRGAISVTRIADVLREFEQPTFEEWAKDYNAWRLFNAVTFVLNGQIVGNPKGSTELHNVIDGICERIH